MKKLLLTISIIGLLFSVTQAQENEKSTDKTEKGVYLKLKKDAHPDIYIDGKKYDYEILDIIDQDKIESIEVVKKEPALKKYNAPNGVILITTKKKAETKLESPSVTIKDHGKRDSTEFRIKGNKLDNTDPVVVIDGVKTDVVTLKTISPDDIKEMEVRKDEQSKKEYNTESGVIIITTKKGDFTIKTK